ncbi:hypothetical protein Q8F55_004483 [Vanrija albida]|uniref:Extracellular membrane protein CFEM domain-containing protein n=1 Tax=Vanrija albida TaxID=181172 RepID=A0ABR3Q757_9TREE
MVALRALLLTALASTALAQAGVCQDECGSLNEYSADPCTDAAKAAIQKCQDCGKSLSLGSLHNATVQLQQLCDPQHQASVSASRASSSASASSKAAASSSAAASSASHAANATVSAPAFVSSGPGLADIQNKDSSASSMRATAGAGIAILAVAAVVSL